MMFGFLYQLAKDAFSFAKIKECEPIDPGTIELKDLVDKGIIDSNVGLSWSAPNKLFGRVEGDNPTHEYVWAMDELRRTKQKIVRRRHDGAIDLVLIRRKPA